MGLELAALGLHLGLCDSEPVGYWPDSMAEGHSKDHGTAWGSEEACAGCGTQLRGVRVKLYDYLGPSGPWAAPSRSWECDCLFSSHSESLIKPELSYF